MEVQSTRSYNFGQAFLNELIDFGMSGFSNLPYSTIFVMIVFLLDTTMRSSTAKLYFVCGYFIELLLFYSFARICFPSETDQKLNPVHYLNYMATPLQRYTHASFFNFSAGYVLGYWGNLNILLNTSNATINVFYYVVFVLFCFLYSVYYLGASSSESLDGNESNAKGRGVCSWQSGLISASIGVVGGMVCSNMIADRVKLENEYDSQFVLNNTPDNNSSKAQLPHGITACDSKSNDMVCKVFRAGG